MNIESQVVPGSRRSGKVLRDRILAWLLTPLIAATALFAIMVAIFPDLDHAHREYVAYITQPSPEKLEALRRKQREAVWARTLVSIGFAGGAGLLTIPLVRVRRRSAAGG